MPSFWTTYITIYDSSPTPSCSGLCSTRAMTMAATSPADSIWTRKTTRLCHLSSRRPHVVSSCQLVDALPLFILSKLRCPLVVVVLPCQLVVALPLDVLSLRPPLVLLSCQLVVASPLLILLLRRPLILLSHWLVVVSPLDVPPSCHLVFL